MPDPLDVGNQEFIAPGTGAAQGGITLPGSMAPVGGRGDPQQRADRLDPETLTVLVDKRPHFFLRRSSSACAKRTGQPQNLVGLAQFFDFAFERLDALTLGGRYAITHASVDLVFLDPIVQRHC